MALFSFYKARRPRQFEHKPIYWDPRKEDLELRTQRIKRELGMEVPDENYKPNIKGTFVEGTSHLKKSIQKGDSIHDRKYKNVRLLVVAALLIVVLYALFFK